MPGSMDPVLSYWINLNHSLTRFSARTVIADKRFYNNYPIRIRFYPVHHWRWFWSRRTECTTTWKYFLKSISDHDKNILKRFFEVNLYKKTGIGSINNKEYRDTYKLIQWMNTLGNPKLRIENRTLDLYTTNPTIFTKLLKVSNLVHEISLVNPALKTDEIECEKLPLDKYKYRVILKEGLVHENLLKVLQDFDKEGTIKITQRRLGDIKTYRNSYGDWFYVGTEHDLTLINLTFGNTIQRVLENVVRRNAGTRTME